MALDIARKQSETLRDSLKGDSCFLELTEDILIKVLVDGQLEVKDIVMFAEAGNSCRKFVQGSARLWLELLRRDFPDDDVPKRSQEHVGSLRDLYRMR